MHPVLETIRARRSVRAYQMRQIQETQLQALLEAARYAPSGGNSQSWQFTVVQNPQALAELHDALVQGFLHMPVDVSTYRSKRAAVAAAKAGKANYFYGAPTLIIASNARDYCNNMFDCAAALENIFLAACALGLGSCWINQMTWLCDEAGVRGCLRALGVPDGHIVCGAAAVGYPDGPAPQAPARREGTVRFVR